MKKQLAVGTENSSKSNGSAASSKAKKSTESGSKNTPSVSHVNSRIGGSQQGSANNVAKEVWEFGEKMGMVPNGVEEEVVSFLRELEVRDRGNTAAKQE